MRIDVYPKNSKLLDNHVFGTTVIVVDVLRATTSIIVALQNNCEKIIPARDAGEAVGIHSRLNLSDCLIAGERAGVKLPDFELGNSPSEFCAEAVKGKTIIFSTSNGTGAINNAKSARTCLLGAMINRTAVAKLAVSLGDDIIILCAGNDDSIGADDILAAGAIIDALVQDLKADVELTDISAVAQLLYKTYAEGRVSIYSFAHCKQLMELGFGDDIDFSFKTDITDIVPVYRNGIIEKSS